jgi:lipid II isoglutaminyl synthase (glutamine-hydrolysing)
VVSKIKFKTLISIIISKAILQLSRHFFKGGSSFPGRVALKIDKSILSTVAKNYSVILVTGTNGKTTTTSMIFNILKASGKDVITNGTGANMLSGIISCFVDNFKFRSNKQRFAVIEVDEANVKFITKYITPAVITITNLFRDQLDRYGEVYTTFNKIMEGITPAKDTVLVLNGDESLLGSLAVENKVVYFGFNSSTSDSTEVDINADAKFCKHCKTPYKYNYITYNHLGSFYCDNCGYKRPELTYTVDEIINLSPDSSTVLLDGKACYLSQPGIYNIYNALCAYSIAKEFGISEEVIFDSLKNQNSHFGRQELIRVFNKELKIILVKNPAGYNQAIDTVKLDTREIGMAFLLNDNYADGRDISWIWDVYFEKLCNHNIKDIFVSGIRLYDMAIRLKIAGLKSEDFVLCENFETLLSSINQSETNTIYILTTYTAMINFRKYLHSKGYIKELW